MGEKGRAWVERDWTWDLTASRLRALIDSARLHPARCVTVRSSGAARAPGRYE